MQLIRSPWFVLVAVAAAAAAFACGGSSPAVSTPPATLAPATPPPAPAPSPGDGAAASSCPLGGGNIEADCARQSARLLPALDLAIDRLLLERPELFNRQDEAGAGTGQYRVLDGDAYLDGVIANLRAAGHCAQRTLDRERVELKASNDFSEEWDILTSTGFMRRGGYSYQKTCTPAVFPVAAADVIAYVRTHLWQFECEPGVVPPPPIEDKLPLRCEGRITATPKQRNGRDVPSWVHGPDVAWELREGEQVVSLDYDWRFGQNPFNQLLRPKGRVGGFVVCATVLGKEGCLNGKTIP